MTPRPQTVVLSVRRVGAGSFDAFVGDRRLCRSRTPFLTAARILQNEGADPYTVLEMWLEGASHFAVQATIKTAASLTVAEGDCAPPHFVKWRPYGGANQ